MSDFEKTIYALAGALVAQIKAANTNESAMYYDQTNSPLTRETHCRLVRLGKVPGFKVAGRILVRRSDLHDYIESNRVVPQLPDDGGPEAIVLAALAQMGMEKKTG
jgi:hypothetical protein